MSASEKPALTELAVVRRQLDAARRENARLLDKIQQFEQIFDAIPDLIFCKDPELRLVYGNRALLDCCDIDSTTELSCAIDNGTGGTVCSPVNSPAACASDAQMFQTGQSVTVEEEAIDRRGATRLFETIKSPIRDSSGAIALLVGVSRDVTAQREAELERQQLATLVENSDDFIGLFGTDGTMRYLNLAGRGLVGLPPDAAIAEQRMPDFLAPEDHDSFRETVLAAVLQAGSWHGAWRLQHFGDGDSVAVDFKLFAVESGAGDRYFAAIGRDLSDRDRAEARLRASRQLLQLVIDNIPQLIFWKDRDCVYRGCNVNFAQAAGVDDPAAIAGKTDFDLPWGETEADAYRSDDRRVMAAGVPELHLLETQHQADGRVIWADTNKIPLRDADGTIVGVLGTYEDITERKAAEEALQAVHARLQQLSDSVPGVAYQFCHSSDDPVGYFTHLSSGCRELFGLDPAAGLADGDRLWRLVHPDDLAPLQASLVAVAQQGSGRWEAEYRIILESGEQKWIQATARAQRQPDGTIQWNGILLDATARKRAESELQEQKQALERTLRELQQAQLQLVQSEKMSSLGQLVAGIAHEINNPVNFIYGNLAHINDYVADLMALANAYREAYPDPSEAILDLLEASDLDFLEEDLPKLLKSMRLGADRIREIVLSLRNFSRLDEAELKDANLHEGLDSTLTILHNRLKPKSDRPGIEVVKNYGDLPQVGCYPGQLNQVFMNVLSNAIDALEERDRHRDRDEIRETPSRIEIRTERAGDFARIAIADNGPGMPSAVQARLFDPFFTTKPVGKGTGLGLSISYQVVVDKHGGRLTCDSRPGEGTAFFIEIPVDRHAT